jgi:hypothetical protein
MWFRISNIIFHQVEVLLRVSRVLSGRCYEESGALADKLPLPGWRFRKLKARSIKRIQALSYHFHFPRCDLSDFRVVIGWSTAAQSCRRAVCARLDPPGAAKLLGWKRTSVMFFGKTSGQRTEDVPACSPFTCSTRQSHNALVITRSFGNTNQMWDLVHNPSSTLNSNLREAVMLERVESYSCYFQFIQLPMLETIKRAYTFQFDDWAKEWGLSVRLVLRQLGFLVPRAVYKCQVEECWDSCTSCAKQWEPNHETQFSTELLSLTFARLGRIPW